MKKKYICVPKVAFLSAHKMVSDRFRFFSAGTQNHRVYRVMPDGTVTVQLSDIGIPVGFAWNSDGSQFYRSDVENGKIWLHDFNLDTGDVCK